MRCVEEAETVNIMPVLVRTNPADGAEHIRTHIERTNAAMELRRSFDEKYKPCAIAAVEKDLGKAVQSFAWL